ncbi:LysR family transcriptional regulator [Eubacteriaceae bacterium ES2]|nr:LysR family transcriptional regulator [Eubacteriaceae bacterium ES2]
MYNPQIDTFINVADAGSFNKAAEKAYISSSAVIKQINLLEDDLGIKLFDRTHRGIVLTNAGKSLYSDAKYIINYCNGTVNRAKNAMRETDNVIRIGTSPMTPPQFLIELWPQIHNYNPDLKFQFITFENTPENAKEILKNLGQNYDVVAGIFDDRLLQIRECAGTVLAKEPLCCAVSINHPQAQKERLTISDLYGQHLHIIGRERMDSMDRLRDEIETFHSPISIIDFEFYNTDVFNQCENSNDILIAIQKWENVHPLLKIIPVDWSFSISFGLLHAREPSEKVLKFIEAIKSTIK